MRGAERQTGSRRTLAAGPLCCVRGRAVRRGIRSRRVEQREALRTKRMSGRVQSAEVVVVGAGPAGSAAALLLARRGRDVLLVDQARFPRDKPCGEYLNPAAVGVLRRLGLEEALQAAGARAVSGVLLTSPAGRMVRVSYPAAGGALPWGLSVPRMALDAALLRAAQAAGVRVREGFRVDDLLRSGERVGGVVGRGENGAATLRARLVVAAGRRCGRLLRSVHRRRALVCAARRGAGGGNGRSRAGRQQGYSVLAPAVPQNGPHPRPLPQKLGEGSIGRVASLAPLPRYLGEG